MLILADISTYMYWNVTALIWYSNKLGAQVNSAFLLESNVPDTGWPEKTSFFIIDPFLIN